MALAEAPALPPLVNERLEDAAAIERLVLRAFGPGRFVKAAERLREGREPRRDLSFTAWEDGQIVGCVRLWDVKIGGAPAILLGPIVVAPDARSQGLGAVLVQHACEACAAAGESVVVLVGDEPYFGPLGFTQAWSVTMPGPVDPARVMVRKLKGDIADPKGLVAPSPPPP